MKQKIIVMVALLMGTLVAWGQAPKMIIGDKAPEVKVSKWLYGAPATGNPMFIEFFHSSSAPCVARLTPLGQMASKLSGKLTVVVISHDTAANIDEVMGSSSKPYYVAIDDNSKTFTAYGVQYVPYGVLVDRKGRIAWMGNPSSLKIETIENLIK